MPLSPFLLACSVINVITECEEAVLDHKVTLGAEAIPAECQDSSLPRTPVSELLWGGEVNLQFIETTLTWVVLSFTAAMWLSPTPVVLKVGFPRSTATASPGDELEPHARALRD